MKEHEGLISEVLHGEKLSEVFSITNNDLVIMERCKKKINNLKEKMKQTEILGLFGESILIDLDNKMTTSIYFKKKILSCEKAEVTEEISIEILEIAKQDKQITHEIDSEVNIIGQAVKIMIKMQR